MPWSPAPTLPTDPIRQGWSPNGPVVVDEPRQGWWPVKQAAIADAGFGEDVAALFAHLLLNDTSSGQDVASLAAHLAFADVAAGTDTAALLAHLTGTDSGTGVDAASWLLHLARAAVDESVGQDASTLFAHLFATDPGIGADTAALFAHLQLADSGVGVDTARPAYMNPYSGSRAATTVPNASWMDLLTFTATGNGTATVTFSVDHSWQRDLFNVVSNTRGVRVLVGGTQVAIQTQTYTNQVWSSTLTQTGVSVPAGASVQIQGYCENGVYTASRTVTISSASMTIQGVS